MFSGGYYIVSPICHRRQQAKDQSVAAADNVDIVKLHEKRVKEKGNFLGRNKGNFYTRKQGKFLYKKKG